MIKSTTHLTLKPLLCGLLASLAACSAPRPLTLPLPFESTTRFFPEVGSVASADVGQGIISKSFVVKKPALKLSTAISDSVMPFGTTTVLPGVLTLDRITEQGRYFSSEMATFTAAGTTQPTKEAGVFVPSDPAQPTVLYDSKSFGKKPITNLEPTTVESWGVDSFRRELVYLGVQQNTITIQYREFKDNIARPAFSQEIKYDLAQGKEIGYRGSRFEVLKATNTELTYRVVKPLD